MTKAKEVDLRNGAHVTALRSLGTTQVLNLVIVEQWTAFPGSNVFGHIVWMLFEMCVCVYASKRENSQGLKVSFLLTLILYFFILQQDVASLG